MFWQPKTKKATPLEPSLKAPATTALRLLQTPPRAGSQLPQHQGRGENLPFFRGYWEFPNLSSKLKSWGDQIKWKQYQCCSSFLVTTAHNFTFYPDLIQLSKAVLALLNDSCSMCCSRHWRYEKLLCKPSQWLKIETKIYNTTAWLRPQHHPTLWQEIRVPDFRTRQSPTVPMRKIRVPGILKQFPKKAIYYC